MTGGNNERLERDLGPVRLLLSTALGFLLAVFGIAVAAPPAIAKNVVGPLPVTVTISVGPTMPAAPNSVGVRGPPQLRPVLDTGVHTYYVLAGTTPVLVHNCGGEVLGHKATCECASGGAPQGPRNGGLAGQTRSRTEVPFDEYGYPDFSAWRHPDVPDVRIDLSGNRPTDFATVWAPHLPDGLHLFYWRG